MPTHPPTDPPNAIALSLILSHISTHPHRLTTRPSQTAFLEKLTRTHKFPYRSPYWGNTYHDAKSLRTVLGNVMRKYGLPITIEEEGEVGKMEGVERLFHYGEEVLDVGFVEAVREAAGEVGDIGVDGIDSDGEEEDEDEGGGSEAEELKALLERDDSEDEEYQPRKGRMREAKRKAVVKIRERRKRKRELDSEDESGSESAVEDGTDSEMDADGEVDSASDTDGASNASTNDSPPPNKRRMSRESSTNRRVSTIARSRNLKRKQLQAQTLSKREQKSGSESDVDMDADGEDETHSDDPSTASSDDDLPPTKRCVKRQRQTAGLSPTGRCRSLERDNSSILLESAGHELDRDVGSGSDADAEGEDEEVECRFDRSASITSASSDNIVVARRRCGGDRAQFGSMASTASVASTALACRRSMSDKIQVGDTAVRESVEVGYGGEDGRLASDSEMDAEGEEEDGEDAAEGVRREEARETGEREEREDVNSFGTSDAFFEDASTEPYDLAERQETPIMLPPLVADESWDHVTTALNEVRRGPNSADERTSTNEVGSDRDADGEDEKDEEVGTYAISIASSSDEEAPSIRSPAKRLRIDSVLHASSDEETLSIVRRAKRSKSRSVSELREAKRQKFASPSNASSSDDDDYGPLRGRTMTRQKTSSTRSSNSQVPPPRHAAKRQRATSTASSTASTASRPRTLPPTTISTSPHPTTRNDPLHPAPESASPPRASQPTGQAGSTEPKAQTTIDLSPDHQPAFVSVDPSIPNPHHCASSIEHTNYGKGSPSPPASAAAASASAAASAAQNVTQQEGPSLAPIVRHVHGSHAHHALPPQGTISAKRAIGRDRAENPVIENDKGCGVSTSVSRKGTGGGGGNGGRGRGAGFDHARFRKAVERMNEGINRAVVGLWEDMMMGGEEEGEGQGEEEVVVL
ncbi:unnamed protein product [Zymoseptoria tritici ST99CH_3D1]|nr:unnamed protein product [Zymoseptoria tritici ST99CH_3D1]